MLREFEGRPYAEIAEVLGITTSALETLLFRARRSLAEELEQLVTCQQAEHSISRSLDARLSRRERKQLQAHLRRCPECARFELVQKRSRRALRGLALVPIPLSLTLLKGTNSAAAASLPTIGTAAAGTAAAVTATTGGGAVAAGAGGLAGSAIALKAAAVVAAVGVAGGVGYTGAKELGGNGTGSPRSQQVRPTVPPGQAKGDGGVHRGLIVRATPAPQASARARGGRAASPSASAPGQLKRTSATSSGQQPTSPAAGGKVNARGKSVRATGTPPGPSRASATAQAATAQAHDNAPGREKPRPERKAGAAVNEQAAGGKTPRAKPQAKPAKPQAKPAAPTAKPPRAH